MKPLTQRNPRITPRSLINQRTKMLIKINLQPGGRRTWRRKAMDSIRKMAEKRGRRRKRREQRRKNQKNQKKVPGRRKRNQIHQRNRGLNQRKKIRRKAKVLRKRLDKLKR